MIDNMAVISIPFNSDDTKISAKKDTLIFKINTNKVPESIFKKYVAPRVRIILLM